MTAGPSDRSLEALVREAVAAFQGGDFAAADRHAAGALRIDPGNYDAGHIRLLAQLNSGQTVEALAGSERLVAAFPDDPFVHNTRGAILQSAGRLEDAARAYAAATERAPQYADGWLNLGMAFAQLGRDREAAEAFRHVERCGGGSAQLSMSLGVSLLRCDDAPGAEAAFRRAHALQPRSAAILSNLSGALSQCGRIDEACDAARQAIALEPALMAARDNLASALLQAGRAQEAEEVTVEARASGSRSARIVLVQALARAQLGRNDEALEPAREAARASPLSAEAAGVAGFAALHAGELEEALEAYGRASDLEPAAARWRFLKALAWPAIMDSREQIAEYARRVELELGDLLEAPGELSDPYRQVGITGLFMAYQGIDDTAFQGSIAQAYRRASPALEWVAPHVARKRDAGRRIRIGIASAYLNNHTIGKLNIGFVHHLDRKRFEVVVVRPEIPTDIISSLFDQAADAVITLPRDLDTARRKLADAELDALFYTDVGLDPFMYFLAFARLARIQFTTWGHPVTTGLPSMDFFLSTKRAEPPGAQRLYHEKLVEFDTLPSFYYRPREASTFDVRKELGLAAATRLYACPQTLFKFHPDLDSAIVALLRQDPDGRLLIVANRHESWTRRLRQRLQRAGPDVVDRVLFIPAMSLPDFLALLRDADALLDTFHFGGGCSSYEAFSMGSPVVTLPAATMRGRVTAAWYGAMGESRWIAETPRHFVELALELASVRERRAEWRAAISEGARTLIENQAVVRELERFVERALAND